MARKTTPETRARIVALAIAACFTGVAYANPEGLTPTLNASVSQSGNVLTVTTYSARTLLAWQRFNIAAGELTRIIQPSASSEVMNRVLAADPSVIYGTLSSNGRVWLVNPAGILIGPGARIDTAGFVASALPVRNEDFLANKLTFGAPDSAGGSVSNQGTIITPQGGSVYLIGANVENKGLIQTPGGETLLAAGQTVQLIDTATPGVKVEITGSDNNATNLGTIVADAGRIGVVGSLVKNNGTLNASSVVREGGRIFLKASQDAYVDGDGRIVTTGTKGGQVEVLGNRVAVMDNASIDASGANGGGSILVGGDTQGKNPEVQNSQVTYFGPDASLKANATDNGDGGKVIVWADDTTRAYGRIEAKGGPDGGNGGFVETSGKRFLTVTGIDVDTRAPSGGIGSWLLDPTDLDIVATDPGDLSFVTDLSGLNSYLTPDVGTGKTSLSVATINSALSSVTLQALNDITFKPGADVDISAGGVGLTAEAGNNIILNADIVTHGGAVSLAAGSAAIAPGSSGSILGSGHNITTDSNGFYGGGTIALVAQGDITIGNLSAKGFSDGTSAPTSGGAVAVLTYDGNISLGVVVTQGGAGGNTSYLTNAGANAGDVGVIAGYAPTGVHTVSLGGIDARGGDGATSSLGASGAGGNGGIVEIAAAGGISAGTVNTSGGNAGNATSAGYSGAAGGSAGHIYLTAEQGGYQGAITLTGALSASGGRGGDGATGVPGGPFSFGGNGGNAGAGGNAASIELVAGGATTINVGIANIGGNPGNPGAYGVGGYGNGLSGNFASSGVSGHLTIDTGSHNLGFGASSSIDTQMLTLGGDSITQVAGSQISAPKLELGNGSTVLVTGDVVLSAGTNAISNVTGAANSLDLAVTGGVQLGGPGRGLAITGALVIDALGGSIYGYTAQPVSADSIDLEAWSDITLTNSSNSANSFSAISHGQGGDSNGHIAFTSSTTFTTNGITAAGSVDLISYGGLTIGTGGIATAGDPIQIAAYGGSISGTGNLVTQGGSVTGYSSAGIGLADIDTHGVPDGTNGGAVQLNATNGDIVTGAIDTRGAHGVDGINIYPEGQFSANTPGGPGGAGGAVELAAHHGSIVVNGTLATGGGEGGALGDDYHWAGPGGQGGNVLFIADFATAAAPASIAVIGAIDTSGGHSGISGTGSVNGGDAGSIEFRLSGAGNFVGSVSLPTIITATGGGTYPAFFQGSPGMDNSVLVVSQGGALTVNTDGTTVSGNFVDVWAAGDIGLTGGISVATTDSPLRLIAGWNGDDQEPAKSGPGSVVFSNAVSAISFGTTGSATIIEADAVSVLSGSHIDVSGNFLTVATPGSPLTMVAGWDGVSVAVPAVGGNTGSITMAATGTLKTTEGDIALMAGNAFSLGHVETYGGYGSFGSHGGNLTASTVAGDITLGTVDTHGGNGSDSAGFGGIVKLEAGGSVSVGTIYAYGGSTGGYVVAAAINGGGGGDVLIAAYGGSVTVGSIDAHGGYGYDAGGHGGLVQIEAMTSVAATTIDARGGYGNNAAGGDAGGVTLITSTGGISTGTITSTGGNSGFGAGGAGGAVSLLSGMDIQAGSIYAYGGFGDFGGNGGSVDLVSHGDITTSGIATYGGFGNINSGAGAGITLTAYGAAPTIYSSFANMNAGYSAAGVTLQAPDADAVLTVGGIVAYSDTVNVLAPKGKIVGDGNIAATDINAASIHLTANQGIGQDTSHPLMVMEGSAASLHFDNVAYGATVASGNVYIAGLGDVHVDHGANYGGDITLASLYQSSGSLVFNADTDFGGNVWASGDVALIADNLVWTNLQGANGKIHGASVNFSPLDAARGVVIDAYGGAVKFVAGNAVLTVAELGKLDTSMVVVGNGTMAGGIALTDSDPANNTPTVAHQPVVLGQGLTLVTGVAITADTALQTGGAGALTTGETNVGVAMAAASINVGDITATSGAVLLEALSGGITTGALEADGHVLAAPNSNAVGTGIGLKAAAGSIGTLGLTATTGSVVVYGGSFSTLGAISAGGSSRTSNDDLIGVGILATGNTGTVVSTYGISSSDGPVLVDAVNNGDITVYSISADGTVTDGAGLAPAGIGIGLFGGNIQVNGNLFANANTGPGGAIVAKASGSFTATAPMQASGTTTVFDTLKGSGTIDGVGIGIAAANGVSIYGGDAGAGAILIDADSNNDGSGTFSLNSNPLATSNINQIIDASGATTGTPAVGIRAADVVIAGLITVGNGGDIALLPSAGQTVGLGNTTGADFTLDNGELQSLRVTPVAASLTPAGSRIWIGDITTGAIVADGATFLDPTAAVGAKLQRIALTGASIDDAGGTTLGIEAAALRLRSLSGSVGAASGSDGLTINGNVLNVVSAGSIDITDSTTGASGPLLVRKLEATLSGADITLASTSNRGVLIEPIAVGQGVTTLGTFNLTSGGAVGEALKDAAGLGNGAAYTVAENGSITAATLNVSAAGGIDLTGGNLIGLLNAANLSAGDIVVRNGGALILGQIGNSAVGGVVNVDAAGALTQSGTGISSVDGAVTLHGASVGASGTPITVTRGTGALTVNSDSDVYLTSAEGFVASRDDVSSGTGAQTVELTAPSFDFDSSQIHDLGADTLVLTATSGGVVFGANAGFYGGTSIVIDASGGIQQLGSATTLAAGDIHLTGASIGTVALPLAVDPGPLNGSNFSATTTAGDVSVALPGDITTSQLDINTAGATAVTMKIVAGGNILVDTDSGRNPVGTGHHDIEGDYLIMQAGGNIEFVTGSVFGGGTMAGGFDNAGSVSLTASGAILNTAYDPASPALNTVGNGTITLLAQAIGQPLKPLTVNSGLGEVAAASSAGGVYLENAGTMTLGPVSALGGAVNATAVGMMKVNAAISSNATGNAVTLFGSGINVAAGGSIATPNGRWLVWSNTADPTTDVLGSLSGNYAFKQYFATYGLTPVQTTTPGNGVLYSPLFAPGPVNITLTNSGVTKSYDGSVGAPAGLVPTFSVSGLAGTETAAVGYTTAAYDDAHVAFANNHLTVGGLSLAQVMDGSVAVYGYPAPNSSSSVSASITPAILTVSLNNTGVTKAYDGTTGTAATAGFVIGGLQGTDAASVSSTGLDYDNAHVVGADHLIASGVSLAGIGGGSFGSQLSDYTLNSVTTATSGAGSASITPAILTVSLNNTGVTKAYDGTTGTAATAGFVIGGLQGTDAASVSSTGLDYDNAHVVGADHLIASGVSLAGIGGGSFGSQLSDYTLNSVTTATSGAGSASITPAVLTVNGNWSSPASWVGAILPFNGDVSGVLIPTGLTVVFDGSAGPTSIPTLTGGTLSMSNGTLAIAGAMSTSGYYQSNGSLSAASVSIDSSGAITQTAGSLNTPSLSTTSVGGTVFAGSNAVGSFQASNSGAGAVQLNNNSPTTKAILSILGIDNPGGAVIINNYGKIVTSGAVIANGDALLTAHSPLLIGSGGISASGNIVLSAGALPTVTSDDVLTINGPLTTSGGNVDLFAGWDLAQNAKISTSGGGVSAWADHGTLVMAANAVTNTSGGPIDYNAMGNVVLGQLNAGAGGTISVVSTAGNVSSAPGFFGVNLIGQTLDVDAAGTINLNVGAPPAVTTVVNEVSNTVASTTDQGTEQPGESSTAPLVVTISSTPSTTQSDSGNQTIGGGTDNFGSTGSETNSGSETTSNGSGEKNGKNKEDSEENKEPKKEEPKTARKVAVCN